MLGAFALSALLLVADSAGPQCKNGESFTGTFDASTTCGAPTVGETVQPRIGRVELNAIGRGQCELGCWDPSVTTISGEEIFANDLIISDYCPAENAVATLTSLGLRIPVLGPDGVTPTEYVCWTTLDGTSTTGTGDPSVIECSGYVSADSNEQLPPCTLTLTPVP